ncbi:MAG: phosphotransferase [Candidatus Andersenbacteria bacterium]
MPTNPEHGPSPEELGLSQSEQTAEKTATSRENETERLIDARLEEVLLHGVEKINEGHNGVIFRADIGKFPPELVEKLKETGIELDETPAIKILKVYEASVGKKEFEAQSAAYQSIAEAQKSSATIAGIPRPILYRELSNLSPEMQQQLSTYGVKNQEKIALLVMELMPGEDLATRMYREVLKRHPQASKVFTDIEHMRVDELFDAVQNTLKLSAVPAGGDIEKRTAIIRHNSSEIYGFLARNNFKLDATVYEQTKNAFTQLHRSGIAHRDAHERNIMVHEENQQLRTTIIDFGSARLFEGKYGDYLYKGSQGEEFIPDEELVKKMELLTKTERGLDNLFYDTKHSGRFLRFIEQLKKEPADRVLDAVWKKSVLQTKNSDERMEFISAALEELHDQEVLTPEQSRTFIERHIAEFTAETAKARGKDKKRHDRDITLLRHALGWSS